MRKLSIEAKWSLWLLGSVLLLILFAYFWHTSLHTKLIRSGWLTADLGYHIEYVLPNGFHGVFTIREDRQFGAPLTQSGQDVQYLIPESGELVTTDIAPFLTWHTESARYLDGTVIPKGARGSETEDRFYSLYMDSKNRIFNLVGKRDEYDKNLQK